MPRSFSKIEQQLWSDQDFHGLSDDGKMLWIYLLTSPLSTFAPGILVGSLLNVAEDLRWIDEDDYVKSIQRTEAAFTEVEQQGWVVLDKKARVIWIPNAVRKNPPRNENVTRGWLRAMLDVPRSELRMKWFRNAAKDLMKLYGRPTRQAPKKDPKHQTNVPGVSELYHINVPGVSKLYHNGINSGVKDSVSQYSGKGQLLVNVASKLDHFGVNDQKLNEFIEQILLIPRQRATNTADDDNQGKHGASPIPTLDTDYIDIDIDIEKDIDIEDPNPSCAEPKKAGEVGTGKSACPAPHGMSKGIPPEQSREEDGNAAEQRTIQECSAPIPVEQEDPPTEPHRKPSSAPPYRKPAARKKPVPKEPKPENPPDSFSARELEMWEALRKAVFYVPGKDEQTGWSAVDDPVRLAIQLGGEAFPNCGPDLIHRLATWTMENRNRAKQKVNRFLINRFSAHQDRGGGAQRSAPPWSRQQDVGPYNHGDDLEAKVKAAKKQGES